MSGQTGTCYKCNNFLALTLSEELKTSCCPSNEIAGIQRCLYIQNTQINKQKPCLQKNSFQLLLLRSIGALHCGDKTLNKENLHLKKSFKIGFQGQHIVPAQNRALLFKSQSFFASQSIYRGLLLRCSNLYTNH